MWTIRILTLASLLWGATLPVAAKTTATTTTTHTPRPQYCSAISTLVSTLSLEASATPFCQSFLSMSTVTTTTTVATTTPVTTLATMTSTITTTITSSTETDYVTSTISTDSIVLQRRAKKSTATPVSTPSALSGRASIIASKACVCLNVPPPTTTISATSTAPTSTSTPVTDVTATSSYFTTTTSTTVTTVYTSTETCASAAFTSPVVNGGFDTGDLSPWYQYGSATGEVTTPGYNSDYSFQVTEESNQYLSLVQDLTTCPGTAYSITFEFMFASDTGADCYIAFFPGGTYIGGANSNSGTVGQWNSGSVQFTASADDTRLEIDMDCFGASDTITIDSIVVTPM